MPFTHSRRAVLSGLVALATGAGCLGTSDTTDATSTDGGSTSATPTDAATDSPEATPTDAATDSSETNQTGTATPNSEAMLDRLPEPSPLANPLPDLVAAEDRESFAHENGLDYRNGTVNVEIELEPDGDVPEEYLVDVESEYAGTVIAYADVDDLVDLALDENVRIVRPSADPVTHSPNESPNGS